jgi:hypothetical protein
MDMHQQAASAQQCAVPSAVPHVNNWMPANCSVWMMLFRHVLPSYRYRGSVFVCSA